jgi:lysine/ornithine N-monooxygenase
VRRPLWQRLRHPQTGIGPGLRSYFYTGAPGLFRLLPRRVRHEIVRTHLRPAAGWPMRERVLGKVPLMLGYALEQVKPQADRIALHLRAKDGTRKVHTTEHIIAATGYKARLDRLTMLSQEIRKHINMEGETPVLGPDFQSSIPGLYFVGVAAANTFGPMLRFAFGSRFTARRLAERIAADLKQPERERQLEKANLQYTTPAQ